MSAEIVALLISSIVFNNNWFPSELTGYHYYMFF